MYSQQYIDSAWTFSFLLKILGRKQSYHCYLKVQVIFFGNQYFNKESVDTDGSEMLSKFSVPGDGQANVKVGYLTQTQKS